MELHVDFTSGAKMVFDFSTYSWVGSTDDADTILFSLITPTKGKPDYPKTYVPESRTDARVSRSQLRELIHNLERLL